jgi:hypothetical protein
LGGDYSTSRWFGYGGQPSRSIKDVRDTTPAYDQPIWMRGGIRLPADLTIADSRPSIPRPLRDTTIRDWRDSVPGGVGATIPDSRLPVEAPPADTEIPDGRSYIGVVSLLAAAVLERKTAQDGFEFARARAREEALRKALSEVEWKAALHPRGRGGRWSQVFVHSASELQPGDRIRLYQEHPGRPRTFSDSEVAHVRDGVAHIHTLSKGKRRFPKRGPVSADQLSHDLPDYQAAGHAKVFRRNDDRTGANLTPRDRVAGYFDLNQPHEMVPVEQLHPTKADPESSYRNATTRMHAAARGEMAKRKPLTGERREDGGVDVVDGNATLEAARRERITHLPVKVDTGFRIPGMTAAGQKEVVRKARRNEAALAAELQREAAIKPSAAGGPTASGIKRMADLMGMPVADYEELLRKARRNEAAIGHTPHPQGGRLPPTRWITDLSGRSTP